MKYFTKWLTVVGGEAGEKDQFMFKINDEWTEPCDFDSYLGAGIQEVKHVKLFLCSKDIKIGDKIFHEPTNTWNTFVEGDLHVFKVIGEVSPGAVWIREGMKFEEHEIEKKWAIVSGTPWVISEEAYKARCGDDETEQKKFKPVVEFRCSNCRTFH